MNKELALSFLAKHQPFPPDGDLSQADLTKLREVLEFIDSYPEPDYVKPLINCFGDGTGFGLYEMAEDIIVFSLPREDVVAELALALESPHAGVRLRACFICFEVYDEKLVSPLVGLMQDSYAIIRRNAACALSEYAHAKAPLQVALLTEMDDEVRDVIQDSLKTIALRPTN